MYPQTAYRIRLGVAALLGVLAPGTSVWALDGANAIGLTPSNGWAAFELVTQGDDLTGLANATYGTTATRGLYDGLGARVTGDTFSVIVNHETTPASISRVDLDLASLQQAIRSTVDGGVTAFPTSMVTSMGFAYDTIFDGGYDAVTNPGPVASGAAAVDAYANTNFARFCSGTIYNPDGFAAGRGFRDEIYITGEEVNGGRLYALDPTTDAFWEVPDVGPGAWENTALVDTGTTTHVGLVLMSDTSSGEPIRFYVGEKNVDANNDGQIDFLERNGLRGGEVHYFIPDAGFSTTDLPDGQVTGTWSTSIIGALFEGKLEDVHTSPFDGTELVFADQTDGVYRMSLDLDFSNGAFDAGASTVTISQIDDDDSGLITAPDNLVWAADNKVYVQEDGGGDQIYEMNPDGTGVLQIADANSEPSGIIDISELLGYEPGGVLLTSLMGSGNSGGQLGVLLAPDAALLAAIAGDYNADGGVDQSDLDLVLLNWGDDASVAGAPSGWVNSQPTGLIGQTELDGVLLNWGNTAEVSGGVVPEPTAAALLAFGTLALVNHRRR